MNAARIFIYDARAVAAELSKPNATAPALAAQRMADMEVRKIGEWPQLSDRKRMLAEMRGQAVAEYQVTSGTAGPVAAFYAELIEQLADAHGKQ